MGVFLLIALSIAFTIASTMRWGPGTHIQLAEQLLDTMTDRLSSEQADLLRENRDCFQYGCIAADIINLKQYGGLANHCHNWSIEERLSALVAHDTERAFVRGYLCHLAADIVAHNHFVPYHLVYGLPPQMLGHTYWEARADSYIPEPIWLIVDELRTDTNLDSNDELIRRAVPKRALSMSSNKFIFNHVLLARSKKRWRSIMEKMRRRHPIGEVQEPYLARCMERCLENMFRTFDPKAHLELRAHDPTEHRSLREARRLRRSLLKAHGDRHSGAGAARLIAEENFGLD